MNRSTVMMAVMAAMGGMGFNYSQREINPKRLKYLNMRKVTGNGTDEIPKPEPKPEPKQVNVPIEMPLSVKEADGSLSQLPGSYVIEPPATERLNEITNT